MYPLNGFFIWAGNPRRPTMYSRRVASHRFMAAPGCRSSPAASPTTIARAESANTTKSAAGYGGGWLRAKLWLRIQADAFLFDPLGYLQALGWRARGLRVRSRNRMAALAGRSPSAYAYWIACKEPLLRTVGDDTVDEAPTATILPLIDCRNSMEGLDQTLRSLPPGTHPVVIGGDAGAGRTTFARIHELSASLKSAEVWVCPLSCGDRLALGALEAYSGAAAGAGKERLIYADDDLIDDAGNRCEPHFKPDWNPELFEHHDFLTGACVIAATREELRELPNESWQAALVRRALERGGAPIHLRHVLHHRRCRPEPVVPWSPQHWVIESAPSVTVIIPTRNRVELLRKCLEAVDEADYPKLDVIVVDNESDEPDSLAFLDELRSRGVRIVRAGGSFNYSALNNLAVPHARGELLCFLNNDIETIERNWLGLLARQAVRPEIGAVGARLLYPDGTVQHAGVFLGIGGGAAHAHRFQRHDERGYFERARLPQRVSAVTGACMVVSRDKFASVGGFDEDDFPVAFNDVDLCLKLNQRGWQSFYEPRATLLHHESKSRGSDRAKANRGRFAKELAALKRKWGTDVERDPFHHPHLSAFCEQFLIAV